MHNKKGNDCYSHFQRWKAEAIRGLAVYSTLYSYLRDLMLEVNFKESLNPKFK